MSTPKKRSTLTARQGEDTPRFLIARQRPIYREGFGTDACTLEILAESKPNESRDQLINRYHAEQNPPPAVVAKAALPKIPDPLLPPAEVEAHPRHDPLLCAEAANVTPKWTADDARLHMAARHAFADSFDPTDIVMLEPPFGDIVVSTFSEAAMRLENFRQICCNPIVGFRQRIPATRRNVVIAFNGPLQSQMDRGFYLGRTLALELSVFNPGKMCAEHWFSVGNASAQVLKEFAQTAIKLGTPTIQNSFDAAWRASMPGAACSPAPMALTMLKEVGIEHDGKTNVILYKKSHEPIATGKKKNKQ